MYWRVCAAVTVLVLVLVAPMGRACPRTCNCYQANEVHCTFRSLLAIPAGLPAHTQRINLGFNSISRIPDNSLAGLKRAELLMLHGNDLHHIPDGAFRDMKSLQVLKLSYNKLREISSALMFSGLTSLLRLHLDHNLLQHIHPRTLLQLPSLRLLRLQGNQLHQLHPHTLCTLSLLNTYYYSTLRHLDLSNNSLTVLPRDAIVTAPLLESLALQANPWSCDCRMKWFLSWSLAHPGLMKCGRGSQCPVCALPKPLQGQGFLQQTDLSCTPPVISSPGRDSPSEADLGENQPIESFREPLGAASLGLSDHQGDSVDLSCNITHSTNFPDINPPSDPSLPSSSPLSIVLSLSLDCPVERESYERLWRILAYYSETAVRLEREIMLSKAPALAYRYRQVAETEGYYNTEVRASIKAKPHWLLQPAISIQLNRAQSSRQKVQLILTTRVSARPDPISHTSSSSYSPFLHPWVLIPTNHTATSVAALVGSRAEISCPILSSGSPTLQWVLPDGSKLISPSSSPDGRLWASASGLLIRRTESLDAGLYLCVAQAGEDVDVLPVRLAVEESSVAPPGEQMGPSVTGVIGDAVSLPCEVSGTPIPDVSWLLPDGNMIQFGSSVSGGITIKSNGNLSLPRLSLKHAGQYRCMAVNQYGADSLSMWLDLNSRSAPSLSSSFPRGPQSAAGQSTRIRVPLLRRPNVEEGSGDEEDEEEARVPAGNRRRPRPPQLPLNQRYPIGHPRRRGPVRGGPLRRGGAVLSPFEQRRNRFENRNRGSATKQRIDPQKWADLLAKIRQRTALNTTSQPSSGGGAGAEPKENDNDNEKENRRGGNEEDSNREKGKIETEGSSIDDTSLQEEGLHPIHIGQKETQTHGETARETVTQTDIQKGGSTETEQHHEKENETDTQTGKESETRAQIEPAKNIETERETDQVTSKPVSGTNEILPETAEKDERPQRPGLSRPQPQSPQQGFFPNMVPNSRSQSPWNTRRRLGPRRKINNRNRGRPLTPPQPLPDPTSQRLQTVTPHSTANHRDTSSLVSTTLSPAENGSIRTHSAAPNGLELSPPISNSFPFSSSETPSPSVPLAYSLSPSLSTSSSPSSFFSSLYHTETQTDAQTHSVSSSDIPSTQTLVHSHAVIASTHTPAAQTDTQKNIYGIQTHTQGHTPPGKYAGEPSSVQIEETERNLIGEPHASLSSTLDLSLSSTSPPTPVHSTTTSIKITTTPTTTPVTVRSTQSSNTTRITISSTTASKITNGITSTTTISPPITTKTASPITLTTTTTTSPATSSISPPSSSTTRGTNIFATAIATSISRSASIPISTTTATTVHTPTVVFITPIPVSTASTTIPTTTPTTTTSATSTIPTTTATTMTSSTTTTPSTTTTTPTTDRTTTSTTSTSVHTIPTTTTSTSTRGERPSPGLVDPRRRTVSGTPNQSRPPPEWKSPGTNFIPDSHSSRPRLPSSPRLPASPRGSGRPVQMNPLGPLVPVMKSRPRIADPHIRTVSAPAESTAGLDCEAQGEPQPSITWIKVSTGAVMSVHSRAQRFEVLPNGTFVIQNVQLQDRGTYICSAHSSLGRDRMLTTLEVWSRPPRMQLVNYREATIHQGGELHLDCQADGVPTPLLSWVLPDRSVLTPTDSSHSRMVMHKNGTLHISVILPSDRGAYRCVASNSAGAASNSVRVHVSSLPPVIHQSAEEHLVLTAGMPVYAHCSARGAPPPTLRWRIPDGTLVRPSQFLHGNIFILPNGTLHIRRLEPKHAGSYECMASNAVGSVKRTIRVELQGGTEGAVTTARQPNSSATQHKGGAPSLPIPSSNTLNSPELSLPSSPSDRSRTSLPSPGSSGSPLPPFHPRLPDSPHSPLENKTLIGISPTHSSTFNDIKFSPLSPSSPLYPSNPTNNTKLSPPSVTSAKVSPSAPTEKSRGPPPLPFPPISHLSKARITSSSPSVTSVHYGGFLHLHCSVSGNPTPTIIWRTPNRKLVDMHFSFDRRLKVQPNGSLSVQAVTEKDAGDYLCIARNKVADDYRLLRVSVATKPAKIEPKQPSNQMVSLGGSLKVDCLASGLPDPAVSWSLPDGTMVNSVLLREDRAGRSRRLTVFDNGTLLVPTVGMGEEGEYTCYAKNQGGQDTMKVKVKVMMTLPPTFTDNPSYKVIKVRQEATAAFRCQAAGDPTPKVTWFSPNNRVIPRSSGLDYLSERVVVKSDGTLEIRLAQSTDAGNYTCQASNTLGERSRVVGLEVEIPNNGPTSIVGGSGVSVRVNGRGGSSSSSSSSSSSNSGGSANTGLNRAFPYYVPTNGVTSRWGSNGAGSSGSSNGWVRDSDPRTYGNTKIDLPISDVTTRVGGSVISVGVSAASNIAIKPGNVGGNINGPGITSTTISTGNGPVGNGVLSIGGMARTSNNEVNNVRSSNDKSASIATDNMNNRTSNTDVISSSVAGKEAVSSIVRGKGLSKSSTTAVTSSGTGFNSRMSGGTGITGTSATNGGTSNSTSPVVSVVTSVKQRAVKGHTVILPCPSHGSPPPRLAWLLPGNGILSAPYYGSRLTVYRNGSLELRGVRASDSGELVCVVRGEIRVKVELVVSETQEEATAQHGGTAVEKPTPRGPGSFTAPHSGGPPASPESAHSQGPRPVFPQTLNSRNLVTEKPPQRALLTPAAPRAVGPVLGSGGPGSEPVRQQPVVNTRTASLVTIINGESLRLSCKASPHSGYNQGSLSWTLPSGEVLSRGESSGGGQYSVLEDGTLIVQQASVFDRGSYACRSTNQESSSTSVVTVPVIVIAYPPRITTGPSPVTYTRPGVALELPCLAIATPRATITWETPDLSQLRATGQARNYGNRYLSAHGSLVIQNPTSRDTGFYRCTAKNVIGADTKATYLHVV